MSIDFQVIANAVIGPDGMVRMELDWSDSLLGEWSDNASEHVSTPRAEEVADLLDKYLAGPGANLRDELVLGRIGDPQ